jgi:hypothetical protein
LLAPQSSLRAVEVQSRTRESRGHSPALGGGHTRRAVARIDVDRWALWRYRVRHPAANPRRLLLYAEREPESARVRVRVRVLG